MSAAAALRPLALLSLAAFAFAAEDAEKIEQRHTQADTRCRQALRTEKYGEAVSRCSAAVAAARQLPRQRTLERIASYGLLGQAQFGKKRFEESLITYRQELALALAELDPAAAELAFAYHHVAIASHVLSQLPNAAEGYAKAEQIMLLALERADSQETKSDYAAQLRKIRENYLTLLQRTGQRRAAAELERRMSESAVTAY